MTDRPAYNWHDPDDLDWVMRDAEEYLDDCLRAGPRVDPPSLQEHE